MLRMFLLSFVLLFPGIVSSQTGDPLTSFSARDQTMNAAMEEAKRTLPLFLRNVTDAEGYGLEAATVKVAFPTDQGAEIIWVGPFLRESDSDFVGLLANQPNYIPGYNQGDLIAFSMDMVRDWSLRTADGTLWGNYTTRVMISELDDDSAAQLSQVLSDDPIPGKW